MPFRRCGAWVALLLGATVAIAGCGGSDGGPAPVTLDGITVAPASVTLASGAVQQFTATGHYSDGSTQAAAVTWSATGGTISGGGAYTAGSTPGDYFVVASTSGGLKDTAAVTIPAPPPPNLVAIEVTPPTATVASGQTQTFSAVGRLSDNSTAAVPVSWTATGGSITQGGVFTAGNAPGSFRVIATEIGGAGLADTSVVTVTAGAGTIVSIAISPDTIRIKPYDSVAVTAVGKLGNGSTVPVTVTWSSPAGTVSALGNFVGAPIALGAYQLIATQQGGTLADTIPVTLHQTTGESVVGPNFWTPTPGVVYLCTSNHFTDDPVGLSATATITATPAVGTITATKPYSTLGWGSYTNFPDGSTIDFVRVACEKVYELPASPPDSVKVKITVSGYSANSGMAKIFTYQNHNNPQSRADYTHNQDWNPPNWTTAAVAESVWVKPTDGANIWFKNTKVPF